MPDTYPEAFATSQRFWCGKVAVCPKLIVPLQIDLAM